MEEIRQDRTMLLHIDIKIYNHKFDGHFGRHYDLTVFGNILSYCTSMSNNVTTIPILVAEITHSMQHRVQQCSCELRQSRLGLYSIAEDKNVLIKLLRNRIRA